MKAFHHSGTNLISVWKSGPRTVVLSEKVKCCFICHSNSDFTSLLKLFWSYHFLWLFLTFLLPPRFRRLPVNPQWICLNFILWNSDQLHLQNFLQYSRCPVMKTQEKGKLWSYFIFSFYKMTRQVFGIITASAILSCWYFITFFTAACCKQWMGETE